jgi:metallophosphoesterase (TIGR00282 family)
LLLIDGGEQTRNASSIRSRRFSAARTAVLAEMALEGFQLSENLFSFSWTLFFGEPESLFGIDAQAYCSTRLIISASTARHKADSFPAMKIPLVMNMLTSKNYCFNYLITSRRKLHFLFLLYSIILQFSSMNLKKPKLGFLRFPSYCTDCLFFWQLSIFEQILNAGYILKMNLVRAVMIGDVVGEPGLKAIETSLPSLIKEFNADFIVVNGENAADGFGMTASDYERITAAGADAVTSGNHVWEKREFWQTLESKSNMLRPANYPADQTGVPGNGFLLVNKNEINWLVINLQGRELISAIDCPFRCLDNITGNFPQEKTVTLIDFHAESSREKEALAYYADGRVSLIAGTHTHIQTTDERILPKGSAYITDLGMTGNTKSVIGMEPKICFERFTKQVQYQMKIAQSPEPGEIQGVVAEIDSDTGKAISIKRFKIG